MIFLINKHDLNENFYLSFNQALIVCIDVNLNQYHEICVYKYSKERKKN